MTFWEYLAIACAIIGVASFFIGKAIEDSAMDDMKGCIGVWLKLFGGAVGIAGTIFCLLKALASK